MIFRPIHPSIHSSIHPFHPIRKLGPSGLGCRSALDPEGTLKVLTRKLSVLRVFAHEFVFFQIFAKKGLPIGGEIKKLTFRSKIFNVTYPVIHGSYDPPSDLVIRSSHRILGSDCDP